MNFIPNAFEPNDVSYHKHKGFKHNKKSFKASCWWKTFLFNYLASIFLLLLRIKLITSQKKMAPINAAKAIQPSIGSSNDIKGSPFAAVKMQSISHISVEAPNVIVKISRCNDFLSLKINHKTPAIMVHTKVVKKYII